MWRSLRSFYSLKGCLASLLLNNIIFVFNVCHISILFIYDSDPSAVGHGHPTQAASLQIVRPFCSCDLPKALVVGASLGSMRWMHEQHGNAGHEEIRHEGVL